MLTIHRHGSWELIESPQDPEKAWELADQLTEQTGIPHYVARI